jgi:hypothetical protein
MGRHPLIAVWLCLALFAAGCERCSERAGADPAGGLPPPVEPRAEAAALPWESVPLGVDRDAFRRAAGALAGIADGDLAARVTCAPRSTLEMIEPGGEAMVERTPAGHDLEGCALLRAGSGAPSGLATVRGDHVDGRLVSVAFSFPPEEEPRLRQALEGRFGPATRRSMTLRTLLGEEPREANLWNVGDTAWLLLPGATAVTLVHQDPRAAAGLGRPAPVPVRGRPVSLDDIGLGGGLDLDTPLRPPDLGFLRALLAEADAGAGDGG